MSVSVPPYALFCVAEVPVKELNKWLEENEIQEQGISELHVVSSPSLDNALKDEPQFGAGTKYPISSVPALPFIGKSAEECATSLKNAPKEIGLDRNHFVVADDQSVKDGSVALYKRGDMHMKGDELSTVRVIASRAADLFSGMDYGTWEETLQHWQDLQQRNGKKYME
ncbi:MAG: hypothetical protein Q9160_005282 [Pyrenula sp. 1 TL-2023]